MIPRGRVGVVRSLYPAAALLVVACGRNPASTSRGQAGPELCAAEIAAGARHSCVRATDGRIWCWGNNEYGQVGGEPAKAARTPRKMTGLPAAAVRVAAGCHNTCAELADGSLWCWGSNKSGQLGAGATGVFATVPVRIAGMEGPFRSVAMNCVYEQPLSWEDPKIESHHICAVKADGSTWCWGAGRYGYFGDGELNAASSPTPVLVQGLGVAAEQVTAGFRHACVRASGSVLCWGANGMGGVGLPAASQTLPPVNVPGLPPIVDVAAGSANTCAVAGDGSVWCWGSNELGESGTGDPMSPRVVHPAAQVPLPGKALRVVAGITSCAMLEHGSVYCWGANQYGELGIGEMYKSSPPANGTATPMEVKLSVAAVSIASTTNHICIASDSDAVWCWGYNASGELGNGTITEIDGIPTPVEVLDYCWQE